MNNAKLQRSAELLREYAAAIDTYLSRKNSHYDSDLESECETLADKLDAEAEERAVKIPQNVSVLKVSFV